MGAEEETREEEELVICESKAGYLCICPHQGPHIHTDSCDKEEECQATTKGCRLLTKEERGKWLRWLIEKAL